CSRAAKSWHCSSPPRLRWPACPEPEKDCCMSSTVLTVPGYHGSGQGHWQTWLESEVAECRRVRRVDWESPILADWALEIRREIDEAVGAVWIVAHSF